MNIHNPCCYFAVCGIPQFIYVNSRATLGKCLQHVSSMTQLKPGTWRPYSRVWGNTCELPVQCWDVATVAVMQIGRYTQLLIQHKCASGVLAKHGPSLGVRPGPRTVLLTLCFVTHDLSQCLSHINRAKPQLWLPSRRPRQLVAVGCAVAEHEAVTSSDHKQFLIDRELGITYVRSAVATLNLMLSH